MNAKKFDYKLHLEGKKERAWRAESPWKTVCNFAGVDCIDWTDSQPVKREESGLKRSFPTALPRFCSASLPVSVFVASCAAGTGYPR